MQQGDEEYASGPRQSDRSDIAGVERKPVAAGSEQSCKGFGHLTGGGPRPCC